MKSEGMIERMTGGLWGVVYPVYDKVFYCQRDSVYHTGCLGPGGLVAL